MGQSSRCLLHLVRVLDPNAADADASAIAAKSGLLRPVPKSRNPVDFCSSSTKPSAPLLNTTTFTGRSSCFEAQQVAHQHGEPAVAGERDHLAVRNVACAPIACAIALAIEPCQNEPSSRRLPFIAR